MTNLERLSELGITLPEAPAPAASYQPYSITGNLILTAGQIATDRGTFVAQGIVGDTIDLETAQACARQCAINILAQVNGAIGTVENIRIVKLNVFVASTPGFTDQHLVANAASNFMAEVLGEQGKHARSAVGVASLPLNSPVEIEAIVEFQK